VKANASWKKLGKVKNRKLGEYFFGGKLPRNATILRTTVPTFYARFTRRLFLPPLLNLLRRSCLSLSFKLHATNLVG